MPQNRLLDRALLISLGLATVAFFFVIKDSFEEHVVQAGDRAPKFSITADTGQTITPTQFGGKVLILNFWATWCAPCIEEMPSLDAFAQATRGSGIVVLAVSIDKNEQAYKSFIERAHPAFLTARDGEASISSDFGSFKWPETYVITSDGKVAQKHIAAQNWMDPAMVNGIKALL